MLSFFKGCFYISISLVSILSYFSIDSHFKNLANKKIERRRHLDQYYSRELRLAYTMMNPDGPCYRKELGEENYEKATQNAAHDGYDRADIELMCSSAFYESVASVELNR